MNYRFVLNQLCLLLAVLGAVLLAVEVMFFIIAHYNEVAVDRDARVALIATGGAGLVVGYFTWFFTRKSKEKSIGRREALLLVAMGWLVGAAFAALPFFIWAHTGDTVTENHPFRSFIDCYFESMSGLTTTGATVLSNIEALPDSILLWRGFTHWLGGLGIVVLFVAILPGLGVGGKRLFRVEAPGPTPEGVTPHIRETARVLWYIYLGLTILEIILLTIGGMSVFEATCQTFATVATGGFSTRDASIGAFPGIFTTVVIIIFMVLAGTNFSLFYHALRGRWSVLRRDPELRVYLILLLGGSTIIALSLMGSAKDIVMTTGESVRADAGAAIREAVFTTVSIQTTTGFCTSDFDRWPFIAKAVLIALMFIGASAGSTGGGIKVVRVWVALKLMIGEIERIFRPNVVRPLRLASAPLDAELKLETLGYVLGIILIFAIGSVGIMVLEAGNVDPLTQEPLCSYATAGSASVATLCNIGPGLARVGAIGNYGWMTQPTKMLLSMLMVIGRLEVFAILVLFTPRFWRSD